MANSVWQQLEEHGLHYDHLRFFLRLLTSSTNGSLTWHYHAGKVTKVDWRVVSSAHPLAVSRVEDEILDETDL